jgi:hypothetical protein
MRTLHENQSDLGLVISASSDAASWGTANVPMPQTHSRPEAVGEAPNGHEWQTVLPALGATRGLAQTRHDDRPGVGEKRPAEHGRASCAPVSETKKPTGAGEHEAASPLATNEPRSHEVHELSPEVAE